MAADPTTTITPVSGNIPAPPGSPKEQSGTAEGPNTYDSTNKWTLTFPGLRKIKGYSIKFVGVDTWYPGICVISGNTVKITCMVTATHAEVANAVNMAGMTCQASAFGE